MSDRRLRFGSRFTSGANKTWLMPVAKGERSVVQKPWNELSEQGKRQRLATQMRAVQNEGIVKPKGKTISLAKVRCLENDDTS